MPGTTASASCLLYLFADRVLPREHLVDHLRLQIAVPTPGTDVEVRLGPLEVHLLAVALWDLDRAGAIRLDGCGGRQRFVVGPGTAVEDPDGVEERLLGLCAGEEVGLWDLVVDRWVGDEDTLPLNAVVIEAQEEAMDLGAIDEPATPDLTPGYLGHHTFPRVAADAGRLEELRPAFDRLAEEWAEAQRGDRVAALVAACRQALTDARPNFASGTVSANL